MFTHHIRSASELEGMGTYKRQKRGDASNGRLGVRSLRQDENEEKMFMLRNQEHVRRDKWLIMDGSFHQEI